MRTPRPSLASFRLRLLFRGAFLLLAAAALALAVFVLREEKQLSYRTYQLGFHKTAAQIAARLRHPTGQLALLNPHAQDVGVTPLHPLLLPFAAIDFDDQGKVEQAVEMSGCMVRYPHDAGACVAVGNNPYAGGFIYVAGSLDAPQLVPHVHGDMALDHAHRVRVAVAMRGQQYRWIAPFELPGDSATVPPTGARGRLTGFIDHGVDTTRERPIKDFRGWIWQSPRCEVADATPATCARRTFFSVRLPVNVLHDDLVQAARPVWPPHDLGQIQVHIELLSPDGGPTLFDSNQPGATPPFSLNELTALLLPGETLHIHKTGVDDAPLVLRNTDPQPAESARFIDRLIRHLPVDAYDPAPEARELIATPVGSYEVVLKGDVRSVNRAIGAVATRASWFVGGMLLAIMAAWLIIEIGLIRRIAILTKRSRSVARTMQGAGELDGFNVSDLRGRDELGILAGCLQDLMQRVREDVAREQIRAEQEKDMWHAVGHEIMSPLQSLKALHGAEDDPSARYIERMQQAIRVLYGSASPSEAFQTTTLQVESVDIDSFLTHVAGNAPCVGIEQVVYTAAGEAVWVRADDYPLEDVVTHVLRNADRYRQPGSAITIRLDVTETQVSVSIHNEGPMIPDEMIDKIFEYGVSDQPESGAHGNRGQGLFVAKTYMAKMGGTITARNVDDGVVFVLTLQRGPAGVVHG